MKRLFSTLFLILLTWGQTMAQDYEAEMKRLGLVDIQSLNPSIKVDLKYSSTDNFLKEDMYGSLNKCYLQAGFAQRVDKAQKALQALYPQYSLLIYDGARPMSIQRKMYAKVAGTALKIYVAPAHRGGRHNYGVAVDLTIVDAEGKPLDMGTPFDFFGEEAHLGDEDRHIQSGRFSAVVKANRALLQEVMRSAGMRPYAKEWWHYQELITMSEVRRRYPRLDF